MYVIKAEQWTGLPSLCFICCNLILASFVFWCPCMVASTSRLISFLSSSLLLKYSLINCSDYKKTVLLNIKHHANVNYKLLNCLYLFFHE